MMTIFSLTVIQFRIPQLDICYFRQLYGGGSVLKSGVSFLNSIGSLCKVSLELELVSKELNHLAAILHVYAGGLKIMK